MNIKVWQRETQNVTQTPSSGKNMWLLLITVCLRTFYAHIQNFASFFQNITQVQELHTKCKTPHISCKTKHCVQNITNTSQKQTFVLRCNHLCHNIIFLDKSYAHSYSKPKAVLSSAPVTFLFKTESYLQRDAKQTFFTVSICGCEYSRGARGTK